ncbi:MAG: ATPase domain-containing protein [Candidatus Hadarchaeales archaeon]
MREERRLKTGIPGFDELIEKGIPEGSTILVAGGPGTGKTIFCLQALYNATAGGANSLYITLEEPPSRLCKHMEKFGWSVHSVKKEEEQVSLKVKGGGLMSIRKLDPIRAARSVEAALAKKTGGLVIELDVGRELIPPDLHPSFVVVDSISAIESAFVGRPESYRIYIEQLFYLLRERATVSFLITETEEAPSRFSRSGVEEFLADGVVVLYNMKVGGTRVRALEILKLRGAKHLTKLVPMEITGKGLVVYPGEKVYGVEEGK